MGDHNAGPNDGDSTGDPTVKLLASPQVNTDITPVSAGAAEAAMRQGGANLAHLGGADFDTADFADGTPDNLRADYALPSRNLQLTGAGVFWLLASDPPSRIFEQWISFESPFANVPLVQVGVVGFDIDSRDTARIKVRAQCMTANGFMLVAETWGHTQVYAIEVSWLALGYA